jgi:small-conductance mechanosensitive channel
MRLRFRKSDDSAPMRGPMFDTHSHEWEEVGLAQKVNAHAVSKARRQAVVLVVLLAGALTLNAVFGHYVATVVHLNKAAQRYTVTYVHHERTWVHILAALAIAVLGWAFARDVGQAAAPTFFRRMDPSTGGTVGFVLRLATVAITVLGALAILQVPLATLAFGGSITAIVLGLAAQQTLGNLFAGMVLLSARPFRVGMRVRLQAGQLGGPVEGVVSSLGLLYTQLARGSDLVLIPNTVVLSSVVVPVREPEPVDVRVRLLSGISATRIQAILDENIRTPTRREPRVTLQEIDGDNVVVRITATPERAVDGAALADEIIGAIATVTGEHETVSPAR